MDAPPRARETYWLTRFVLLRLLGLIYAIAFLAAVQQLVPLVGSHGLTPARLFMPLVAEHFGSTFNAFWQLPSLFWFDSSDTALRVIPWIGLILSCAVATGFANSIVLVVLWALYLSIVHVGQDWYGFGWEIQLCETGFLAIFLVPLLDARPFPARPTPYVVIVLLRVLVWKIMIGAGLIKLRGDAWWHDLTALQYFFETQPIPNPLSVYFHHLPHPILQFGVIFTFFVELVVPWFVFWPPPARLASGLIIISLQIILIVGGNFAFLNWLTLLPAVACLDDRFLRWVLPGPLVAQATQAESTKKLFRPMEYTSYALAVLIGGLTIPVVVNLCRSDQRMIESYEPFDLVSSYGVFGAVTQNIGWPTRHVIVYEGITGSDPKAETGWKEYRWLAQISDPAASPIQVAPYQPHLDWQLWFAPMGTPDQFPWTVSLLNKLLQNDPGALSLIGPNPFSHAPPKYIRIVEYIYHFAPPGNPQHVYWTRERVGLWCPALGDQPELHQFLQEHGLEEQGK